MEKRRLGKTSLDFTTVGLGTWAIGGPWDWGWGAQDDTLSIETIRYAIEIGVNWVDTAPCYGLGHSERIVGEAIRDIRDKVFVATKCGLPFDDVSSRTVVSRLKKESVRKEVYDSLERLGIEVIDLYQMHWPDPEEDIEEAWEEMARIAEEGLVRYIGVSNFGVSQLERANRIHPIASLQPPYSMIHRGFEADVQAWCAQNKVGVLPYSPMQAGLLTGSFSHERRAALPADDWRLKNEYFREPMFSHHLETVEMLRPLARELGISLAELSIAWTLRNPEVTSAIVGARRPDQIEGTFSASGIQLDEHIQSNIELILTRN